MKSLHIQLQPDLAPGLDCMAEAERLRRVAESTRVIGSIQIVEGNDDGKYINIDLRTEDLVSVWSRLRQEWRLGSLLAGCSIVCCEGDRGWDDYRLLHHFDPSEPLDEVV